MRGETSLYFRAAFGLLFSLALVLALSSCAAPLNPVINRESGSLVTPVVTSPDSVQSLDEESSCVQFVFEPERSAILGEALADPQLQAVRQQGEVCLP
ncbi:MAG: hypothetical protein A2Z21_02065 [Candidatus Fraserbacteria bacterium RBG_16_55_9]|uniref:Uncharacterized protein n=1 Tax=Fraserbacteria sp. (strain RBG_16_55_9) TaxID=1817864 RepID=A0A1F5V1B8_FRAXR|nr:MAG: hypothetical protein A2Z21_02065 [Candidatus Fraserbacteria bacterium RBG_16_55_9]